MRERLLDLVLTVLICGYAFALVCLGLALLRMAGLI